MRCHSEGIIVVTLLSRKSMRVCITQPFLRNSFNASGMSMICCGRGGLAKVLRIACGAPVLKCFVT